MPLRPLAHLRARALFLASVCVACVACNAVTTDAVAEPPAAAPIPASPERAPAIASASSPAA
ncbi:MAG: hypothetical protein EP329_18745, partial [Deltaproteobacteria bacterium]